MPPELLVAFTDGACSGNPGPGGWAAILAWPHGRVTELAGGEAKTTNNRMEMRSAIAVLRAAAEFSGALEVRADSTYVITGITSWIFGWKRKGWKNSAGDPVLNRDLWEEMDALVSSRGRQRLSWRHVRGHSGVPGNERCDELAVAFSHGETPTLYDGPAAEYPVDLALEARRGA
ncbi:MAG: ribonuclease HI [Elusimicrobia bacterium]|nr:ribonuclease HI [Elusimicrobiota bacterium]